MEKERMNYRNALMIVKEHLEDITMIFPKTINKSSLRIKICITM